MLKDNEKNLRIIGYILALFTNIIGILIMYLVVNTPEYSEELKKDIRNLLNNSISYTIYYAISVLLMFVLIGLLGFIVFPILELVFLIIGLIKAINNESYKLPLTINFIK